MDRQTTVIWGSLERLAEWQLLTKSINKVMVCSPQKNGKARTGFENLASGNNAGLRQHHMRCPVL